MASATGGCQCGAVRFELSGGRLALYVCHCRECQKQSASAFGISAIYPAAALRLLQGAIGNWSRATDRGRTLQCWFCAACGTRLWHANPDGQEISVKGGALDAAPDLTQATHIWTARKLAGITVPPASPQFPAEPD